MFISNPTGRQGEELAAKYLKDKGYKIIEKNFRKGYGEIDIIAIKDGVLVFIEVKTRTTRLFGGALEAIAYRKLKSLIKTAQYYKILHPKLPESLRIDAILIDFEKNDVKNIEHIENISF
jgi:putative endonuclease